MNLTFVAKLGRMLLNENDALWVQVVRSKYVRHDEFVLSDLSHHRQSSNAWKGMSQAKYILDKGIQSLVGNGRKIHFWLDKWLINEFLINMAQVEISLVEKYKMVSEYWDEIAGWR